MVVKRDILGRRIPQFDRSSAAAKGAKTRKDNYGPDIHARVGATGGRARKRGYFGTLKDEGRSAELKAISTEGAKKANEAKRAKVKRNKVAVPRARKGSA